MTAKKSNLHVLKHLNTSKRKQDVKKLNTPLKARLEMLFCLKLNQRFFRSSGTLKQDLKSCHKDQYSRNLSTVPVHPE